MRWSGSSSASCNEFTFFEMIGLVLQTGEAGRPRANSFSSASFCTFFTSSPLLVFSVTSESATGPSSSKGRPLSSLLRPSLKLEPRDLVSLSSHRPDSRSLSPRLSSSQCKDYRSCISPFFPSLSSSPCLAPLVQDGASRAPPAWLLALPPSWPSPPPSYRQPCLSPQEIRSCSECVSLIPLCLSYRMPSRNPSFKID